MNEISQNMRLQTPSLTLYAFHLRNSINQGLQPTVAAAPRLWEQLVDFGNALNILELQTLRQQLICYEGERYLPESEDTLGAEYLTLLQNNEPSLDFQVPPQPGGLELQGLLCPFRLHDTYAIDLTLCSQDTFTLSQLKYLNPQNLILQNIQASLGKTLLLFGQPLETQEDNYQVLADACVAQLFPGQYSSELVDTGSLLGNPIFEYESGLTNLANKLHILVWLKCHDMSSNHMDRVAEILLHLLWCRHKILYVYQQSRHCLEQAKKIYGSYEKYRSNFSQISEATNRRSPLINLHAELQQVELDYTNYLDDLTEHEKTIAINYINYKTYLEKLEKLPHTKLSFCQEFLRHVGNKFQRQIQVDRDSQRIGRDRLQRLKATVWESITTEPVASEPWSGQGSGEQECKSALALQKELHYYGNNALKNNMSGIPSEIYDRLYEALLDCDQFDDAGTLRKFFKGNAPLNPWRNYWQQGSPSNLVQEAIGYLCDKHRDDTKENALVILVRLLANRIDSADSRHQILNKLAQELNSVLSDSNNNSKIVPFTKKLDIAHSESSPTDRLAQEANPQGESMVYISEYEKILTCAASVARISVPKIINGCIDKVPKVPTGTAWLVTPELAFTCWHVIEARSYREDCISEVDIQAQLANTLLFFDNILPGQGTEYGVKKLEHYNRDFDYALLRLKDENFSLESRGFLKLETNQNAPLTVQTQLFVIQHPKGEPKQGSSGYFVKIAPDTNCILYNAPTDKGTSGAPVLKTNNWQVIALHNGEKKNEALREATLISDILSDLKQNRLQLYEEIMKAQKSHKE
ncbi:serine protease [Microcoleus sp. EPA2]|uniref:trypsin-like serine peptidase n=1 Tax=Microcoleus sp. EPA2 TaxID=2841654 RepID=UPI00312B6672